MRVLFRIREHPAHSFCSASALSPWLRRRKRRRKTNKDKEKNPSSLELKQQTAAPKQVSVSIRPTKGPKCQARGTKDEEKGELQEEGAEEEEETQLTSRFPELFWMGLSLPHTKGGRPGHCRPEVTALEDQL